MSKKNYLRQPYTRALIPDESGGYFAEILEFPGCFAEGDTVEKTYKELEGAAKSWIEARLSQGQEVPEPFDNLGFSGTISLRLPRSIHKRASVMAERDQVSLNSFLLTAIASRVGAEDFYTHLAQRFEQQLVQTAMWVRFEQTKPGESLIRSLDFKKTAKTTDPALSYSEK
jgi:antitoxin HicB